MQCAEVGCETRKSTGIDEKVISFRKQNVANSISYKQGNAQCISKLISLCRHLLSICDLGVSRIILSAKVKGGDCASLNYFAYTS